MGNWNNDQFKKYDTSKGFGNKRKWQRAFNERMGSDEAKEILESDPRSPWEILGIGSVLNTISGGCFGLNK